MGGPAPIQGFPSGAMPGGMDFSDPASWLADLLLAEGIVDFDTYTELVFGDSWDANGGKQIPAHGFQVGTPGATFDKGRSRKHDATAGSYTRLWDITTLPNDGSTYKFIVAMHGSQDADPQAFQLAIRNGVGAGASTAALSFGWSRNIAGGHVRMAALGGVVDAGDPNGQVLGSVLVPQGYACVFEVTIPSGVAATLENWRAYIRFGSGVGWHALGEAFMSTSQSALDTWSTGGVTQVFLDHVQNAGNNWHYHIGPLGMWVKKTA